MVKWSIESLGASLSARMEDVDSSDCTSCETNARSKPPVLQVTKKWDDDDPDFAIHTPLISVPYRSPDLNSACVDKCFDRAAASGSPNWPYGCVGRAHVNIAALSSLEFCGG